MYLRNHRLLLQFIAVLPLAIVAPLFGWTAPGPLLASPPNVVDSSKPKPSDRSESAEQLSAAEMVTDDFLRRFNHAQGLYEGQRDPKLIKEAVRLLEEIADDPAFRILDPADRADLHRALGMASFRVQDYPRSAKYLELLVDSDQPATETHWRWLLQSLTQTKRYNDARQRLKQWQATPQPPQPYLAASIEDYIAVFEGRAVAATQTKTIPKEHSIHALSEVVSPEHPALNPLPDLFPADTRMPVWTFHLARVEYRSGDPMIATLTVKNPNPKTAFTFSPPFVGVRVATVGVWRRKWDAGLDKWGELEQVLPLNGGEAKDHRPALKGQSIVLKGGAEAAVRFPINVLQYRSGVPEAGVADSRWLPGIGFAEPGKYQVFLKYLDLGAFFVAGPGVEKPAVTPRAEDPLRLPFEPVVIGPFDVTILPLEDDAVQRDLVAMIRRWEANGGQLAPDNGLAAMSDLLDRLDKKHGTLKPSLTLCRIRHDMVMHIAKGDKDRLQALLTETKLHMNWAARDLHDFFRLTECHLLDALGRRSEAVAAAQKLRTADAADLLAHWRHAEK